MHLVRAPQLSALPTSLTRTTIDEDYNRTRGDLRQLAATLNNPLKRSPGAYARAFLFSLPNERRAAENA
jgi:hypothetical protein